MVSQSRKTGSAASSPAAASRLYRFFDAPTASHAAPASTEVSSGCGCCVTAQSSPTGSRAPAASTANASCRSHRSACLCLLLSSRSGARSNLAVPAGESITLAPAASNNPMAPHLVVPFTSGAAGAPGHTTAPVSDVTLEHGEPDCCGLPILSVLVSDCLQAHEPDFGQPARRERPARERTAAFRYPSPRLGCARHARG